MRLDVHYIRKELVPEPTKADIVDFVNAQLALGFRANDIAKLVKETYFSQELGDLDTNIIILTHDTDDPETGGKDTTTLIQAVY